MSRNKYPEETIQLILRVSNKLFIEKGYNNTSIQDITNKINLSKGAIYHHFKSKEDIFLRICDEMGYEISRQLASVRDRKDLNGKEKLSAIFRESFSSDSQKTSFQIMPNLIENPKFLAMSLKQIYEIVAPNFIEPILSEGIGDGSLKVENPKELAEAMSVLTNIWLNPHARPKDKQETASRVKVYNAMLKGVGIELMDNETLEDYIASLM